jgi:hypothetical protein
MSEAPEEEVAQKAALLIKEQNKIDAVQVSLIEKDETIAEQAAAMAANAPRRNEERRADELRFSTTASNES